METDKPLSGFRVVEIASGVAAAQAGRQFSFMGAETIMIELPSGSPLRGEPPFVDVDQTQSALFCHLSAGKRSVVCDLDSETGQEQLRTLLEDADILVDDTPVALRPERGLDPASIAEEFPKLVFVSVLPFGATGSKSEWVGEEINLIHASGEGYLLPNGLTAGMFPERPPLKIAGHFAQMQGGVTAALAGLSALWSGGGEFVDVSVQDANVAVGAFAIQRFGDGSIEHRLSRSFRYGGVIECSDGFVELLTLEERQWQGLMKLMGSPAWANDPDLSDASGRSARGDEINEYIRSWAKAWKVDELVDQAQQLGVPMAPYNTPEQVLAGEHENFRRQFHRLSLEQGQSIRIPSLPYRFGVDSLAPSGAVPAIGADQHLVQVNSEQDC